MEIIFIVFCSDGGGKMPMISREEKGGVEVPSMEGQGMGWLEC